MYNIIIFLPIEVISSDLLKPEYEGSGDEMDLSDIFPISTVPLFPSSVFHTTTLSILESETSILLPFSTEIEMFTSIDIKLSTFLPVETSSLIYTTPSFIFSTATPSLLMSSSPLPSSPLFSLSSINRGKNYCKYYIILFDSQNAKSQAHIYMYICYSGTGMSWNQDCYQDRDWGWDC